MSATITAGLVRSDADRSAMEKLRELSTLTRSTVLALPVASVIFLNLVAAQEIQNDLRIVASFLALLSWIPFVVHVFFNRKGLPFMPLLGLIYGIYFSSGVFLLEKFHLRMVRFSLSDELVYRTELLALLGYICLLLGYYIFPERALEGLPRVRIPMDPKRSTQAAVLIGLATTVIFFLEPVLQVPIQFRALFILLAQMQSFVIALLFYYQLQGRLSKAYVFTLWAVLVPAKTLNSMTSGLLAQVMFDALILMGAYWVARRKWPWKAALVFAVLIIPFLGVKHEYRNAVWRAEESPGVVGRASLFVDLVLEGFETRENFFSESYRAVVERSDMLTTFAAVVYLTPDVVPYWGGDSYATLFWALIPRFLYPDKPQKVLGQGFGHRYALLDRKDTTTSYNFPQVVEMYANFGPWGVGVGMFLVGIICRVLYFMFSHEQAGDGGILCGVVIFTRLCNVESDFSLVYGGLALNILALYLILKLIQTKVVRLPLDALRWR
jgi:hypothetical protein